jgi:hypothetical protein
MTPAGKPEIKVGNAPSPPGDMPTPWNQPAPNAGHDMEATVRKALLEELNRNAKGLQAQQGQQLLRGLQNDGSWVPYAVGGFAAVVAGGGAYLVYRACDRENASCAFD